MEKGTKTFPVLVIESINLLRSRAIDVEMIVTFCSVVSVPRIASQSKLSTLPTDIILDHLLPILYGDDLPLIIQPFITGGSLKGKGKKATPHYPTILARTKGFTFEDIRDCIRYRYHGYHTQGSIGWPTFISVSLKALVKKGKLRIIDEDIDKDVEPKPGNGVRVVLA